LGQTAGTEQLPALLKIARDYRISDSKAKQIISEINAATSEWVTLARNYGIPTTEIDLYATAFESLRPTAKALL